MNKTAIVTNSDEDFIVVNEVNKFQKITNKLYKHNNKLSIKKLITEIKLFKQHQHISSEVTKYHISKLEKQLNTTNFNETNDENDNNNDNDDNDNNDDNNNDDDNDNNNDNNHNDDNNNDDDNENNNDNNI